MEKKIPRSIMSLGRLRSNCEDRDVTKEEEEEEEEAGGGGGDGGGGGGE